MKDKKEAQVSEHQALEQQLLFERLSEADFSNLKVEWDVLHAASGQSVFTSWSWTYAWWQVFKESDYDLCLVACRSEQRLVAILPFYVVSEPFLKLFSLRRLYFIGCKGRGEAGYRAEYLDFIVAKDEKKGIKERLLGYLVENSGADELVLNDVPLSSSYLSAISSVALKSRAYVRETARDQTYYVSMQSGHEAFLSGLGKGTRARIKGSERRMVEQSSFSVRNISGIGSQVLLASLKELQAKRWDNQESFSGYSKFLDALLSLGDGEDWGEGSEIELVGVQLEYEGAVVAATLDVRYESAVYNLMLGFSEVDVKRVSLGLLALSLDIKRRSRDGEKLAIYDLLAGSGKRTDYKAKIAQKGAELVSHQLLLSWLPRLIYQSYDRLNRIKSAIKKGA